MRKDSKKSAESLIKSSENLQEFLYDSMPIDQVRKALEWARLRPSFSKKVLIFENAERMLESSRNALLKILEEPPADTVFILTTSNRGAMMQTILSRVRTYTFQERSFSVQKDVLRAVFMEENAQTIRDYLDSFLPLSPIQVREIAKSYFSKIRSLSIPRADDVVKSCASFSPRFLLKEFLLCILEESSNFSNSFASESSSFVFDAVRECWNFVTVYNQTPIAAIERLTRQLFLSQRFSR